MPPAGNRNDIALMPLAAGGEVSFALENYVACYDLSSAPVRSMLYIRRGANDVLEFTLSVTAATVARALANL